MTIIRNQDYEQFSQIEDERIRESFRVLYDNTAALQEQVEQLKAKIVEATDLADLQTEVSTLFDGSAITNAVSSSLPVATSSTLGGVKDGAGVTIATDGTLSVDTHTHTHDHDSDYADINHGHSGFASSGHAHAGVYQPAGSYASSGHTHSYAASNHNHAGVYLETLPSHNHNYQPVGNYANSVHSHSGYVADTNTYWKNAIQSYGNGSSHNSELPIRLSTQAGGQIFTFVGNSNGNHMMIYRNGSFYSWVGSPLASWDQQTRNKWAMAYAWQSDSLTLFTNNDRRDRLYLRNSNNSYEVGMFYLRDYGTGIGIYLYRYTMTNAASSTPSFVYQSHSLIGSTT